MKQTIEQRKAGFTTLAAAAVVALRRFHTVTGNGRTSRTVTGNGDVGMGYVGIGNANWPATKPMHAATTCHRPRGASPQT